MTQTSLQLCDVFWPGFLRQLQKRGLTYLRTTLRVLPRFPKAAAEFHINLWDAIKPSPTGGGGALRLQHHVHRGRPRHSKHRRMTRKAMSRSRSRSALFVASGSRPTGAEVRRDGRE
jgi:hypothetical protein